MTKKEISIDYQSILHCAPDLYLILDTNFTIVDVSNAYLQATMVIRKDIVGKGLFDAFPENPDDPTTSTGVANLRTSLTNVLNNRAPDAMAIQKYDIRRPLSEGGAFEVRYWSPINLPVFDDNQNIKYILHRVEDVTEFIHLRDSKAEQSKLMEELQTRAGYMEVEIYQRAQEIQEMNHQLQYANQRLAKLDQIKTQFFANISHELRTPLTLILGPLDKMLMDTNLPSSTISDLELVKANAQILLRHVNDLLDISKLEAGKMKLQYAQIDLPLLIRQTAALFQPRIEDRTLSLSLAAPDELIVHIDVDKIQRVLMNLISNAIKFTPPNGVVNIHLEKRGTHALLIIEDSGPGISPEFHEKIFDRFFQVEETMSRKYGGSGLGLAIAKDFIELHGGSIKVGNSTSGGAKFLLEFPLKAPRNTSLAANIPPPPDENGVASQLIKELRIPRLPPPVLKKSDEPKNTPRILIVEDNPEMNRYLCDLLSGLYQVDRTFNGVDGLKKAIELRPDLIVTDIMMPQMNGIELVHSIRKHSELLTTPIIILTAKVDDKVCVQMLREGAQDCLIKPFSADELLARVSNLLINKKVEDELERFVYLASHDLKSPLPAMKNLITWIEEDLGEHIPEESKKHFLLLRKRTARMSSLLEGLITYSQAGHLPLDVTNVDSKLLVEDIIHLLNPPETFTIQYEKDLPIFYTAKTPLKQVLTALMDNSVKHHHHNHGHIDIGVHDMGNFYQFYVSDDGPGIEPQYQQKIFQLFQTLKPRDVLESSGVGLSIVKKIIESLGCSISVESKSNRGTIFSFTWPKQM